MKKIFSFAAMLFAAMTINAQEADTISCAGAVSVMPAQQNDETTVEYVVVGYVTKLLSNPSPSRTDANVNQQRFYMDDVKGSAQTVNCYWCDLPAAYKDAGLNVGDKIAVKGKIINYSDQPELKNAPITMLERNELQIDTFEVDACEAIEEGSSLNDEATTDDIFIVRGRLKGIDDKNNYGQHTFEIACTDSTAFKAYMCAGADSLTLGKGDSVAVTGKLYNFHGTIEISNGKVELIEKSGQEEIIIEANVAEATAAAMALANGASSEDRYAITGYVDSIAIAYSDQYNNISFFMTDDMAQPTYTFEAYRVKCTADQAAQLGLGAKVKVTAAIQHYYKEADPQKELPEINLAETVAGGELEIIEPVQGIENLVLTEKAQKVVVDGVVYIIRDNKLFNALGTQVK